MHIWALVSVGRERELTAEEKRDLQRLCAVLREVPPLEPASFATEFGRVCGRIDGFTQDSAGADGAEVDGLLREIQRLRQMLESDH